MTLGELVASRLLFTVTATVEVVPGVTGIAGAGTTTVISPSETTAADEPGRPPNSTRTGAWKPPPSTLTVSPPPGPPESGLTSVRKSWSPT